MKKEIHVVGAAILEGDKILAMQRSETMSLPLLWEFPGGKIEAGESEEEALVREIKEELVVDIEVIDYINTASYDYDFGQVTLSVYTARITGGSLKLREHANHKWLTRDELKHLDWAPVDLPAVALLSQ